MNKPQIRRYVALFERTKSITFYATPDIAEEAEEFGAVTKWAKTPNAYSLTVDLRYDPEEVAAWLTQLGIK